MLGSLPTCHKTDFVLQCGTALKLSLIISDYSPGACAKSKVLELHLYHGETSFFFRQASSLSEILKIQRVNINQQHQGTMTMHINISSIHRKTAIQKHKESALYTLLNFIYQKLFLGYSGDPKDFLELLFLLKINVG